MTRLLLLIATLFFFGLLPPSLPATPAALPGEGSPGFAQRSQALLDGVIALQEPATYGSKFRYWHAQALLANGHIAEGRSAVEEALANQEGDMFRVWAMADTYLRWQHLLSDATREAFKNQLTGYTGYNAGLTENHRLMLATARYLASMVWPTASFASNFKTNDPTGRTFLLNRMNQYVHQGTVEFDSPAYHAFYLGAMRSLADLAQEVEMRNKAVLTAEWLILENVGEWLDGHWLSASLRQTSYYDGQGDFLPTDYVMWVYFGASVSPDFADKKAVFAVQAAVSPYRLSEDLAEAATSRADALVHRETDIWGGRHHYGTTYLNGAYGLYSVMEDYKVHTFFGDQYHRWAVQWLSGQDKSTLYVKHPHKTTGEEGTTGYEEVLQHEGTLLAVYAIPTTYPTRYVRLRTPQGFNAVINQSYAGDVFFHYGSVLVALRMSQPFVWNAASDEHDQPATFLGVVVETAPPSAYPGTAYQQLLAFKSHVQQHPLVFSTLNNQPKLTYTTIHNDVLLIKYDGKRKINGVRLHPEETWPLLDNPWMHQDVAGDQLVVETCQQKITYDFGSWTKQVTPPTQSCQQTAARRAEHSQPAGPLSETNQAAVPASVSLGPNYPNPFNPTTTISYTVHEAAHVSLKIYNLLGQEVATLVDESQTQDAYTVRWDARDRADRPLASGTYLYRLEAGDFVQTKRMLLLK